MEKLDQASLDGKDDKEKQAASGLIDEDIMDDSADSKGSDYYSHQKRSSDALDSPFRDKDDMKERGDSQNLGSGSDEISY